MVQSRNFGVRRRGDPPIETEKVSPTRGGEGSSEEEQPHTFEEIADACRKKTKAETPRELTWQLGTER